MRASSLSVRCRHKHAVPSNSGATVNRSIPLRHLKVHPPAVNDGSPAARVLTARSLVRPSFVDLLRRPPRPPLRPPGSGLSSGDATSVSAPPQPEAAPAVSAVSDVTELPHTTPSMTAPDPVTEWGGSLETDRLDDLAAAAKRPPSKPVVASDITALQADPRGHHIVNYVAATVSNFCNDPAVRSSDGWAVRLALNSTILPATTLHLRLSLHWLLLRFDCGDAQSRQVIALHHGTLQSALEDALVPRREVSIDLD
jgi:type III secretion control protein HpaP